MNWKQKLEQFKQWTRDHATEIVVWSAAGSALAGVIYQGYGTYRGVKTNNELLKMTRESVDHYKENFKG